jgi:hypothetical protein
LAVVANHWVLVTILTASVWYMTRSELVLFLTHVGLCEDTLLADVTELRMKYLKGNGMPEETGEKHELLQSKEPIFGLRPEPRTKSLCPHLTCYTTLPHQV